MTLAFIFLKESPSTICAVAKALPRSAGGL